MSGNGNGLVIHRGSRVERLADTLAQTLDAQRPADPLRAQTVLVAHPGLKRWLLGELARRPLADGSDGIAANLDLILPWQWLERVAADTLGGDAASAARWRREVLRWRLLEALPALDAEPVRRYLDGGDEPRRRFQLADHLAGVYTQYLIYRPEWLLAWEDRPAASADDWQAQLWRLLQAGAATPHRARRARSLVRALAAGAGGDAPLHVFGVSHLPPDVLAALRAYAQHAQVRLYFPDPCREHWVELRRRRDLLRLAEAPEALYYEVGHPLLAALGRIAQDFCLALDEGDPIEERDAADEDDAAVDDAPLLERLQASIRRLQPELAGAGAAAPEAVSDASLRVHLCHTPLRELEVLKDALLRALADDPALAPRDIVVMAPDIAVYAPYLPAVFGEPGRYRSDPAQVPWHLSDVGLASQHPLIGAFDDLLDLPESRFAAGEVLGLLDVPAIARRFAIDAAGRQAIEHWLRRAHVAWGLDAQAKAAAGAAALDAHSWQFGFDRLYAGLVLGGDRPDHLLDGRILPLAGVAGGAVEALGQLDRLLGLLRRLQAAMALPRPIEEACDRLVEAIDELFLIDRAGTDRDALAEAAALDALRRQVQALGEQARTAGSTAAQPWSVLRDALRAQLRAVPERQPFLLGGVTFCGLVPQRSIPFGMVCLLGLNEGDFPRGGGEAGLNRIAMQPRRGDRDARSEDRYLFLEALMAARRRLHLSYVGIGVHDGRPRNPAAPLAELLSFLDEAHGLADAEGAERPWHIVHPLQPFDPRYYERAADGRTLHDPRLFSYESRYLTPPLATPAERRFVAPDQRYPAAPAVDTGELSLAALARYWRDPPRDLLRQTVGISLEAADADVFDDREPLEARVAPLDRFDRRLLLDALAAGADRVPAEAPPWLARAGVLPSGAPGARAYAGARAAAEAALGVARALLGEVPAIAAAQAVELTLGDGRRLGGRCERVYRLGDGRRLLFDAQPARPADFRDLLPFYLDLAVLRLTADPAFEAGFVEGGEGVRAARAGTPPLLAALLAQTPAQLADGLQRLIALWDARRTQPLPFFPRTAWAYATAAPGERLLRAQRRWHGDGSGWQRGERDYAPGYAGLFARGASPVDPGSALHAGFVAAVEAVCAVLDPQRTVLLCADAAEAGA
ncbi:MAG TPA: exodeoxyribonuclease V subunit gamma [Dokdonella sp.]|uniref:exodeoxyribonuclease V subunit gamma n=1 Tax=Dokdonella sp. TaxID=2291710 RepID=UPI002C2D7A3A|nr:exodeoxyribonuclease V subunit gamma [Dokdonella sp.]HUD41674.1 exodeoxyribonuclease V subunit gamma [Dokdonella sp.]